MSGWRLWLTGWPDQAAVYAAHAEAHAARLAHPFSLVYALLYGVLVRQGRGDCTAAAAAAQHLASVAREQGFVYYEVVGMLLQGSVWTRKRRVGTWPQSAHHGSGTISPPRLSVYSPRVS